MTDSLARRPDLPAADLHERIREAAIALLLTERRAITAETIATATGIPLIRTTPPNRAATTANRGAPSPRQHGDRADRG